MMGTARTEEIIFEAIRLTRAQERVGALLQPLKQVADALDEVEEVAPDLGPELNAVRERTKESLEHLLSALQVIQTKVEMI